MTVASTAIDIARDVFAADAYALWRVDRGGAWRIIRAFGISDDFASRALRKIEFARMLEEKYASDPDAPGGVEMGKPARSMPAAALTAYARSQDRITSLASGFQMHLVKPIDPLELIVAVATQAPRRSMATSPSES